VHEGKIEDHTNLADTEPSIAYREATPGSAGRRPLFSDVADLRQHLRAEPFERFYQLVGKPFRKPGRLA
jgi:hypothetical protein